MGEGACLPFSKSSYGHVSDIWCCLRELFAQLKILLISTIKMDEPYEQFSATALRKLLITEVKTFVASLETTSPEKLQEMRDRLIGIYKTLTEKEQLEMLPLVWGRNAVDKKPDTKAVPPVVDAVESSPAADEDDPIEAKPS